MTPSVNSILNGFLIIFAALSGFSAPRFAHGAAAARNTCEALFLSSEGVDLATSIPNISFVKLPKNTAKSAELVQISQSTGADTVYFEFPNGVTIYMDKPKPGTMANFYGIFSRNPGFDLYLYHGRRRHFDGDVDANAIKTQYGDLTKARLIEIQMLPPARYERYYPSAGPRPLLLLEDGRMLYFGQPRAPIDAANPRKTVQIDSVEADGRARSWTKTVENYILATDFYSEGMNYSFLYIKYRGDDTIYTYTPSQVLPWDGPTKLTITEFNQMIRDAEQAAKENRPYDPREQEFSTIWNAWAKKRESLSALP